MSAVLKPVTANGQPDFKVADMSLDRKSVV